VNVPQPLERIRRKHREGLTDAVLHRRAYLLWRDRLVALGKDPAGIRVLDIGAGDRAPLSLQFAVDGAMVAAVDLKKVHLGRRRPLMWLTLLRTEGVQSAGRLVFIDLIHTFRYWRHLARLTGRSLPFAQVSIAVADALALPYRDRSFDVVVSSAVWEHLPDVDAASREVNRVLKSDGIAVIQIALFPSLSGGHQAEWHSVAPRARSLRPWDHLRSGGVPPPLYLNGWREGQYREALEAILNVVEWEDGGMEGASYLTDDLRAELAAWSERDLLLPSITAWCTKLAVHGSGGVAAAQEVPVGHVVGDDHLRERIPQGDHLLPTNSLLDRSEEAIVGVLPDPAHRLS
jgi:SAM-dependent methyltransferase